MFDKLKKIAIENRTQDEILYEYVLEEIEQGIRTKGLWAKALAHSDGIQSKAEAMYMQYRVQSIKDQFNTLKIAYNEMSRQRLFDYIKSGFNDTNLDITAEKEKVSDVKSDVVKYKTKNGTPIDTENNTDDSFDILIGLVKFTGLCIAFFVIVNFLSSLR